MWHRVKAYQGLCTSMQHQKNRDIRHNDIIRTHHTPWEFPSLDTSWPPTQRQQQLSLIFECHRDRDTPSYNMTAWFNMVRSISSECQIFLQHDFCYDSTASWRTRSWFHRGKHILNSNLINYSFFIIASSNSPVATSSNGSKSCVSWAVGVFAF